MDMSDMWANEREKDLINEFDDFATITFFPFGLSNSTYLTFTTITSRPFFDLMTSTLPSIRFEFLAQEKGSTN